MVRGRRSEGCPDAGSDRDEKENCPHRVPQAGQSLIAAEQVSFRKQECPIMFAAAHERQLHRTSIGDVDRDIPAILRHPPQADRGAKVITTPQEVRAKDRGNDELEQGPAKGGDDFAERREDQVARLVDGEVHSVDEMSAHRVAHVRNAVERERRHERETCVTAGLRRHGKLEPGGFTERRRHRRIV